MTFLGMDTQAVQQLAQQMSHSADQIENIMQTLTHSLTGTQWTGPDREQFVSDWQSTHCTALRTVVQGLRDAAQKAMQNAQQQEQTSSTL